MYLCDICNYTTENKSNYNKHCKTGKHKQKVIHVNKNANENTVGARHVPAPRCLVPNKCQKCDRFFSSKGVLNRHLLKIHKIDHRKKSSKLTVKTGIRTEPISQKLAGKNPKLADLQESKSLTCGQCLRVFAHSSSFSRHHTRCWAKKEKIERLNRLEEENNKMKKEIEKKDKIIDNTTKANKYAMSTFNTLVKKFIKAPPLQKIQQPEIETIMYKGVKDKELISALIYYNRNKTLVKYIGGAIVSSYKKDDPRTQSLWNSDTQRLSYIIRALANDNIYWVRNAGGTQVTEYIIQPILDYLDVAIRDHIKNTPRNNFSGIVEYNEHMLDAHRLSNEITDKKKLGDEILVYITPFFNFKGTELIDIE